MFAQTIEIELETSDVFWDIGCPNILNIRTSEHYNQFLTKKHPRCRVGGLGHNQDRSFGEQAQARPKKCLQDNGIFVGDSLYLVLQLWCRTFASSSLLRDKSSIVRHNYGVDKCGLVFKVHIT